MRGTTVTKKEQKLEKVLNSNKKTEDKVSKITHLGYSEEMADYLVDRQQKGLHNLVYYESLAFVDLDDE